MNHLDMCSGIGGWALAFRELGINTIGFCEIDKYPQQVLQKNFPNIPIFNDLKELTYEQIKERTGTRDIDIVTCSYPCQPFSVAGKQKGEEDSRHLWPDTFRIVQECKPTWFVGENVGGHIKLGLDTVLEDLASEGYDTRTFVIPASSIGAWHQRKRIWIIGHKTVANTSSLRDGGRGFKQCRIPKWQFLPEEQEGREVWCEAERCSTPYGEDVSDTKSEGLSGSRGQESNTNRARMEQRKGQEQGTIRSKSKRCGGVSTDVSDTESQRTGKNNEGLRQGVSRVDGRQTTDVSNTSSEGLQGLNAKSSINEPQLGQSTNHDDERRTSEGVCNPDSRRFKSSESKTEQETGLSESSKRRAEQENWWQTQSELCGVPDGVSYGLDKGRVGRIKGLGNAIVPQIAWHIGNAILQANGESK